MRMIRERRKQRERLEVGLLLLPIRFGIRQRAVEQPDQMTGFAVRRAKHAEVKLVVRDHVNEGVDAREPARRAQMQWPPRRRRGERSSSRILVRVIIDWAMLRFRVVGRHKSTRLVG